MILSYKLMRSKCKPFTYIVQVKFDSLPILFYFFGSSSLSRHYLHHRSLFPPPRLSLPPLSPSLHYPFPFSLSPPTPPPPQRGKCAEWLAHVMENTILTANVNELNMQCKILFQCIIKRYRSWRKKVVTRKKEE